MNELPKEIKPFYDLVRSARQDLSKKSLVSQETLEPILKSALDQLSAYKDGTNPPETLKAKAVEILRDLHTKLEPLLDPAAKAIDLLIEGKLIEIEERKVKPIKTDVKLAFFCDIDAEDQNGAISSCLNNALEFKAPFVTTRSQFNCTQLKENEVRPLASDKSEELLLENSDEWEIFQRGEFLIFIPISAIQGTDKTEILASFDFKTDESTKKISVNQVFSPPEKKAEIEGFIDLFSEEPKKSKLIYIAGHGRIGAPAGLTTENYNKFLGLLSSQQCNGLTIASCYAGGESTLLHLPNSEDTDQPVGNEENKIAKFTTKYPVIVRSSGDFTSLSKQYAEKDIGLYFQELEAFISSDDGVTISTFRKTLEKAEEGESATKTPQNLAQVYFPSSRDSPSGFRPVGEGGKSFSLTYNKVAGHRLLQGGRFIPTVPAKEIKVTNRDFLELHPIVVDCSLVYHEKDPIFLFMIPGKAHHFIEKITLGESTAQEFVKKNHDFYKEAKLAVSKVVVTNKLSFGDQLWEKVALSINAKGASCLYYENGQYFYWNTTDDPRPITEIQYTLLLKELLKNSEPKSVAVRSHTGGQQDKKQFENALCNDSFWGNPKDSMESFLKSIPTLSKNELKRLLEEKKFSTEDKEFLAFHLLKYHRTNLLQFLIEEADLSPNCADISGVPLVLHCVSEGEERFVNYLLDKGVNPNSCYPNKGNSLLLLAVAKDNAQLVKRLIGTEGIDLELKNKDGNTAIIYAYDNLPLFKALKDKGADIAIKGNDGETVLTLACRYAPEHVEEFLKLGVDPNLGDPPPLFHAIKSNNLKQVEILLAYRANPVQAASRGLPLIHEAMLRSPPGIVKILLDNPHCDPNIADNDGVTPLMVAIRIANPRYIEELYNRGAKLAETLSYPTLEWLQKGLKRMNKEDGVSTIRLLLEKEKEQEDNTLAETAFDICAASHPEGFIELINTGVFRAQSATIFRKACVLATQDAEKYQGLLTAIMAKGFKLTPRLFEAVMHTSDVPTLKRLLELSSDPSSYLDAVVAMGSIELLQFVFEKEPDLRLDKEKMKSSLNTLVSTLWNPTEGRIATIKWLVLQGADLNNIIKSTTSFTHIVKSGNLALINWCLDNAKVDLVTPGKSSLLFLAAKNQDDNKWEIYKSLVEHGADQNGLEQSGDYATPFVLAAESGDLNLVNWCIDHGAKLDPVALGKYSSLHVAGMAQREEDPEGRVYKRLVDWGANQNAPNQKGSFTTPFAYIVYGGNFDLIQWSLGKGANANPDNPDNRITAIEAAARLTTTENGKEIVLELLEAGADIKQKGLGELPPLIPALCSGDLELVTLFFDKGAVIENEKTAIENAFSGAIASGNVALIKLLNERGFTIPQGEFVDEKGLLVNGYLAGGTPMFDLLLRETDVPAMDPEKKAEFWKKMVGQGDFINFQKLTRFKAFLDENRVAIQTEAAKTGKQVYFEELEKLGIKIEAKQVLDLDEEIQDLKLLNFLIDRIDDVFERKQIIQSMFVQATINGDLPLIEFLLGKNASPNQKSRYGLFLFNAIENKNSALVKLLLDYGANVGLKKADWDGTESTTLEAAEKSGSKEIVALIKEALRQK